MRPGDRAGEGGPLEAVSEVSILRLGDGSPRVAKVGGAMSAPDTIYEKQLIASVLMAPADTFALEEVSAVKPEHFHDLELRRVFQTAQQAHTEGGYVSPASIAARLSDEGPTLAELGGVATAVTSSPR